MQFIIMRHDLNEIPGETTSTTQITVWIDMDLIRAETFSVKGLSIICNKHFQMSIKRRFRIFQDRLI